MALGSFVTIVSLVLGQLEDSQRQLAESRHRQAVLTVATMAVQPGQDNLNLTGVSVTVVRQGQTVTIYEGDKEVWHLVRQ